MFCVTIEFESHTDVAKHNNMVDALRDFADCVEMVYEFDEIVIAITYEGENNKILFKPAE